MRLIWITTLNWLPLNVPYSIYTSHFPIYQFLILRVLNTRVMHSGLLNPPYYFSWKPVLRGNMSYSVFLPAERVAVRRRHNFYSNRGVIPSFIYISSASYNLLPLKRAPNNLTISLLMVKFLSENFYCWFYSTLYITFQFTSIFIYENRSNFKFVRDLFSSRRCRQVSFKAIRHL